MNKVDKSIKEKNVGYFKQGLFVKEDDKSWKEWVDSTKPTDHNLCDLAVNAEIRMSIRRRALFTLLAPRPEWIPFYWRGEFDGVPSFIDDDFFASLSPELVKCAAIWIKDFWDTLRPLFCEIPNVVEQGVQSSRIILQIPDEYEDTLTRYNRCIIYLLPLLPLDSQEAADLFDIFSLKDLSAFWSFDDASGYWPVRNLLFKPAINMKWKRIANERLQAIVESEIKGETKSRAEWEEAAKHYAYIVKDALAAKTPPYDLELLFEQIVFCIAKKLIDADWHENLPYVWNLLKTYKGRFEDTTGMMRAKFCGLVALNTDCSLALWSPEMKLMAEEILQEFPHDAALQAVLKKAIEDYSAKEQQARDAKLAKEAEKKKIEGILQGLM